MEKIIKILSGYTIVFGIYVIIANSFIIGRDVRMTLGHFLLALMTILPMIILAVLILVYFKKKT